MTLVDTIICSLERELSTAKEKQEIYSINVLDKLLKEARSLASPSSVSMTYNCQICSKQVRRLRNNKYCTACFDVLID